MSRMVWLGVVALAACSGGDVEGVASEPLSEPTVEFEVVVPEVDTDWPLAEDSDV